MSVKCRDASFAFADHCGYATFRVRLSAATLLGSAFGCPKQRVPEKAQGNISVTTEAGLKTMNQKWTGWNLLEESH